MTFSSPPAFGGYQCIKKVGYKTDVSTSIGWYINIISVNEITGFNCKFKLEPNDLKCYYHIFYGKNLETTAAGFS